MIPQQCIAHPYCSIFASLARAREHLRARNVRDFSKAKPHSEINVRFSLNKHGATHILMHEFNLHRGICIVSPFEEYLKILLKID